MQHRPAPEALDLDTSTTALRAVATFEAVKGGVVLFLGLGLLSLLHRDAEEIAENLLVHLHIDPDHRMAQAMLRAAAKITDARLWAIAGGAVVYATVRLTEAWGLWYRRVWAEWFAMLSGALYLPFEIVKVIERPNLLHIGIFLGNVVIVLYMVYIRLRAYRVVGASQTAL